MWQNDELIEILKQDKVAVMPTDTLYGIVGCALSKETVERIYMLRKRNPEKPCIILVGDISEIHKFNVTISKEQEEAFVHLSATPTSIILDCADENFAYLHRGTKTLAFRLPVSHDLRNLLLHTGPLVAPSANLEGMLPAKNVDEALDYFGDGVDLYVDGGEIDSKASRVVRLEPDGTVTVLRE